MTRKFWSRVYDVTTNMKIKKIWILFYFGTYHSYKPQLENASKRHKSRTDDYTRLKFSTKIHYNIM